MGPMSGAVLFSLQRCRSGNGPRMAYTGFWASIVREEGIGRGGGGETGLRGYLEGTHWGIFGKMGVSEWDPLWDFG